MKNLGAAVAVAVVCSTLWQQSAEADPRCRSVRGTLDLIPVSAPCTSPVGVCGKGDFRGMLRGPYTSNLLTLLSTAETPQTGVVLITGETTLQARLGFRTGTLQFKDSGAFKTVGDGEFSEIFSVVGGSQGFAGATGTLIVTGTFDFAGGGEGEYSGTLCVP